MDRKDIELIVLTVKSPKDMAIHMKIYKDGTLVRSGAGGFPGMTTAGIASQADTTVFERLLPEVADEVLDEPLYLRAGNVTDEERLLDFTAVFFGKSKNGEHGEGAEWELEQGVGLAFDPTEPVDNPLLPYLDGLVSLAARLTNSWYFDVMIEAGLNMRSTTLPPQTITTLSPDEEEVRIDFGNYLQQIRMSPHGWTLNELSANKVYKNDRGEVFSLSFSEQGNQIHYQFTPIA